MNIRRLPCLAALTVAVVVVLTACSPAAFAPYAVRPPAPTAPVEPGNRLLVSGFDGNLFTIRPDGSERVYLTEDAGSGRLYRQPTWSPDATTVAAARVDARGDAMIGSLLTIGHDGSTRTRLTVGNPPFYLFWSPTGERIAYLSNWVGIEGPTMALRLFDVAANTADTVAEGAPYFFSWAPDGTQLVAHLGDERVEVQRADGQRSTIAEVAPGFGAPQWSAVGDLLLYAVNGGSNRRLVVTDASGAQQRELTDFPERISAGMSPDARKVAYVLTSSASSANTLGPLYVTEVDTLRTKQLSERPVWAFEWSPDGSRLAWLASERLDGAIWMRWHVWDGESTTAYTPFLPSRTYLNDYLTYSDQYAQSTRLWSPDSTAIAYAGMDQNERRGIWVQQIDAPAPEWVSGGVMVTWSPQ